VKRSQQGTYWHSFEGTVKTINLMAKGGDMSAWTSN